MKQLNKVIKETKKLLEVSSDAEKEIENTLNNYLSKPTKVFVYENVIMIKINPVDILNKEALKKCFTSLYLTHKQHFLIPIPKEIFTKKEIKELHLKGKEKEVD